MKQLQLEFKDNDPEEFEVVEIWDPAVQVYDQDSEPRLYYLIHWKETPAFEDTTLVSSIRADWWKRFIKTIPT